MELLPTDKNRFNNTIIINTMSFNIITTHTQNISTISAKETPCLFIVLLSRLLDGDFI